MTSAADGDAPVEGDDQTTDREGTNGSVVERLAEELESGNVSEEHAERLRVALFDDDSGSLAARVEKLQRDVDEVLAYASALEAFLDENGTGEEVIAETREEIAEIRSELEDLGTEVAETQRTVDRAATGLDDVEESVADVESELERVDSEIESLQEWRRELVSVMSGAGIANGSDESGETDG